MQELWKPVDFGTNYQVSSYGQVRNIKFGRFLSGWINEDGYRRVLLSEGKKHKSAYVHLLVAEAFIGPCPDGQQVRHLDGDPANNRWAPGETAEQVIAAGGNLIYGTPAENCEDRDKRHGRNGHANKTHCGTCGLPYDEENTYIYPEGSLRAGARECRNCSRASGRRSLERNREERNRRVRERSAAARAARPELLTTGQAADLLGVSSETIRRWCTQGRLPFTMAGVEKRLRRADVMRFS